MGSGEVLAERHIWSSWVLSSCNSVILLKLNPLIRAWLVGLAGCRERMTSYSVIFWMRKLRPGRWGQFRQWVSGSAGSRIQASYLLLQQVFPDTGLLGASPWEEDRKHICTQANLFNHHNNSFSIWSHPHSKVWWQVCPIKKLHHYFSVSQRPVIWVLSLWIFDIISFVLIFISHFSLNQFLTLHK